MGQSKPCRNPSKKEAFNRHNGLTKLDDLTQKQTKKSLFSRNVLCKRNDQSFISHKTFNLDKRLLFFK